MTFEARLANGCDGRRRRRPAQRAQRLLSCWAAKLLDLILVRKLVPRNPDRCVPPHPDRHTRPSVVLLRRRCPRPCWVRVAKAAVIAKRCEGLKRSRPSAAFRQQTAGVICPVVNSGQASQSLPARSVLRHSGPVPPIARPRLPDGMRAISTIPPASAPWLRPRWNIPWHWDAVRRA